MLFESLTLNFFYVTRQREDQTWRDAKESQTELHGLAEDLQSTIASYGVKVRDEARSVLQPEDLVAKCSQVLEQVGPCLSHLFIFDARIPSTNVLKS